MKKLFAFALIAMVQATSIGWAQTNTQSLSPATISVGKAAADSGGETVADIDGNVYHTVKIGNQTWLVENLAATRFNDGTAIPRVTDGKHWHELTTPGFCWYGNSEAKNGTTYGALYNWHAVNSGKLCPPGWHVPTDKEWTELADFINSWAVAAGRLKEPGNAHWIGPNAGMEEDKLVGFKAIPGGYRLGNGTFLGIGAYGFWWCADAANNQTAWRRLMFYNKGEVARSNNSKQNGASVRCVKDR